MAKVIAIDFDGTMVAHAYPAIGREAPNAVRVIKKLMEQDYKIILWTMRDGDELLNAVAWCEERGIVLWGVNHNAEQSEWTNSPKTYANIYIDDLALGCPTIWDEGTQRNMVNWRDVEAILVRKGVLIK